MENLSKERKLNLIVVMVILIIGIISFFFMPEYLVNRELERKREVLNTDSFYLKYINGKLVNGAWIINDSIYTHLGDYKSRYLGEYDAYDIAERGDYLCKNADALDLWVIKQDSHSIEFPNYFYFYGEDD